MEDYQHYFAHARMMTSIHAAAHKRCVSHVVALIDRQRT